MSSSIANHNQDFGPKLSPDPSWTGPLNVKRSTTNVISLIIFMLCFICWIVVPLSSKKKKKKKNKLPYHCLEKLIVLGMLVFSALLSTLYICLMRIAPMKVIYASIGLLFVSLAFGIGLYAYKLAVQGYWKWDHWLPLVGLCSFLPAPASALTSYAIDRYKLASQIIPEFAKVALFFPSLYLYAILIFALCCCVFIGAYAAVLSTTVFTSWFALTWLWVAPIYVIWLCCTLVASFNVTVAGAYATWYWTTDKRQVPYFTVGRFIWIALRYHLGSAAIGGVVLPVCYLIRFCSGGRVAALGDYLAFEQMALHGRPLLESARMAHNLWHRNYERSEEIAENVKNSTLIIWLSVCFASPFLVHRGVLLALSWDKMSFLFYFIPFIFNGLLAFIMFQLINIACDTVLLCVHEDHEVNGKNARNMSDKLKQLIFETERK
ncbi:choline transporter-like protein 2 [Trichogramma pretiosum]|uniref:choline transporter-like protein 2 n=1 Tax=Trichogramma pretiosum TaxID=7493 RepID=UPI000C719CE5|nr:choline transporter-like protein 2 [Trichogramma pretiosum]